MDKEYTIEIFKEKKINIEPKIINEADHQMIF